MLLRRKCVVPLRRVKVDAVEAVLDLLAGRALARDGVHQERRRQHAVPGELGRVVIVRLLEGPGEVVDQLLELVAGRQRLAEHAHRPLDEHALSSGAGRLDVQGGRLGGGHHQRDAVLEIRPALGDHDRRCARRPS